VSPRRVELAAVPSEVSTQTIPWALVFRVPTVDVARVKKPVLRLVLDAVMKDEYIVEEL
jgi:hypothetical protein